MSNKKFPTKVEKRYKSLWDLISGFFKPQTRVVQTAKAGVLNPSLSNKKIELDKDTIRKIESEDKEILKEKERIEEDRLAGLKKERRKEQIQAFKDKFIGFFKKKPKLEKY